MQQRRREPQRARDEYHKENPDLTKNPYEDCHKLAHALVNSQLE